MGNFVLAEALPAASYQLLVFPWQLLHATPGCNHKTSSSTPLRDQSEDSHNIRGNPQTKLQPTHLKSKVEHQSEWNTADLLILCQGGDTAAGEMLCSIILYLLRSVFSLNSFWCFCAVGSVSFPVCVYVFVCAGSSLAWHSGALVLSFPSPRCSQEDKLCHSLICHTGFYLSPLPICLLICSLSSSGDIIHATEGEKEGYRSAAPHRLQRDTAPPTGEPRTETCRDATCMHNTSHLAEKKISHLCCNQVGINNKSWWTTK